MSADMDADATAGHVVIEIVGHSTSQRMTGPECTSPVGLCTRGHITGTISGDYQSVATELVPSSVPGVIYVRASTVIQTGEGELRIEEHAIVNTAPSGFGEHTSLGEITGGTGGWSGATGYLHAVGDAASGANRSTISGKARLIQQTATE